MTELKKMFDGSEGEIISGSVAETIKGRHQNRKKEIKAAGLDNYVEAEFFGIKQFGKLMDRFKGTAVGFRVYYGSQWEDHSKGDIELTSEGVGKKTSRLVIVPVDAYGRDLLDTYEMGLKDMPDSGGALANGPMCPNHCTPPKKNPSEN